MTQAGEQSARAIEEESPARPPDRVRVMRFQSDPTRRCFCPADRARLRPMRYAIYQAQWRWAGPSLGLGIPTHGIAAYDIASGASSPAAADLALT